MSEALKDARKKWWRAARMPMGEWDAFDAGWNAREAALSRSAPDTALAESTLKVPGPSLTSARIAEIATEAELAWWYNAPRRSGGLRSFFIESIRKALREAGVRVERQE